jgi:conjugative transfer region protein TrbK
MKPSSAPRQLMRVTAIAVVLLAMAVIQGRRGEETAVFRSVEPGTPDARVSELARCRTITPDDPGLLESCRHIWAENRQRFFLSTKSPQLPAASALNTSARVQSQDLVLPHGTDQGGSR